MVAPFPDLIDCYRQFIDYSDAFEKEKKIDLSRATWFCPTTLLPLGSYILNKRNSVQYIPPVDNKVSRYLSIMLNDQKYQTKTPTFMPMAKLPPDLQEGNKFLSQLSEFHQRGKDFGGENAFNYIMGEIVTNIYEHSHFTEAWVMVQRYDRAKMVELCFFDNGVTIPGSFEKNEVHFERDIDALIKAVSGKSTKGGKERGYGLSTSIELLKNGLNGELLLVSRGGGLLFKKEATNAYDLSQKHILHGTLVGVRIPFSNQLVDIYPYIENR